MSTTLDRGWFRLFALLALCFALSLAAAPSHADSGFYAGGSVGSATVEDDVDDVNLGDFKFDDNDFAWKAFAGYNFELALFDLAVEGGYVDFGSQSDNDIKVQADALDLFGVIGVDIGPIGVFAKAGVINWDTDVRAFGLKVSDDGTDPAYGVGARFMLGSLEIRAEYEYFDIEDIDDTYLLSAGLAWTF